tara:strand:+ start:1960 stop:3489 length:1530 start_codon:yes stop_codon:yes gene_type:complete
MLAGISTRFFITLVTNMLRMGFSFYTGLTIARFLGPNNYGNFSFLLGSFTALINLVDLGSSSAFFTIISKKERSRKFYFYYAIWACIQFLILLLFLFLLPDNILDRIWLGHSKNLVLLALVASFSMNMIWKLSGQIGESIRDTFGVQARNLALAFLYLLCVLGLVVFKILSVERLFVLNAIIYFLFSFLYVLRLYRTGTFSVSDEDNILSVFKEFKDFCSPLVIYTIFSFFYSFLDYWLLQRFGGSTQQGYYAVGLRFSTVILIASTSILQVFWKEISEAYSKGNITKVQVLYSKVSKMFFFFSMAFCCFLIPFSRDIITLFLGPEYMKAWATLSLMFFYPVHQSLGQITSTMLYAIGKTKTASYSGIFFMLLSIVTAYFVLAPRSSIVPGLELGSIGLALKMVVCQIIGVNIWAFYVAKYINIPFDWRHQIRVLFFLPVGIFSKIFSDYLLTLILVKEYIILNMIFSGLLYLTILAILIYNFPEIAGLDTKQIKQGLSTVRKRFYGSE